MDEHAHTERSLGGRVRRTSRRVGGLVAMALAVALVGAACIPHLDPAITPGNPGASDVQFTISSDVGLKDISSLIYGINGIADQAQLDTVKPTLVRSGGNRLTAYNWENNASNAGSDWCFQNDGYLSASNTPGEAILPMVNQAIGAGAAALVTVPIVDYVAADKNGGCDVRNSGPNYLQTRFKQNRSTKPTALSATPDATDGFVYQDEFVNWLKNKPNTNGKVLFSLDNEPDLWSSTHAEVHPNPVTYTELANRNLDYGRAVKRVWPGAVVTGPVNYGFYGYETLQGAPDAGSHGNFLDWYLDQTRAAKVADGHSVVDVLDLHWYPEATGGGVRITGTDTGAAVVAAREQAPRSLWDPTYTETSWITTDYGYGPIRLIPRTRDRIAAHDPGMMMGFTEWNYGGGNHISGAIATADVLGIFGREGVALACFWPLNGSESYSYAGFRAYRNFDGVGGHFGDVSMSATTSDTATATVYASLDSADPNHVVLVAINKATTTKRAGIRVAHPHTFTQANAYTVTAAGGPQPVPAGTITSVATNAFNYTMPAQSITVLDLRP